MGKRDDIIEAMIAEAKKLNLTLEDDFITKVTKGLGPVIYNKDTATVACGQADELETVKKNFLKKKLGLTNDDKELDEAIKEVCEKLGKSNRSKYRVHFYALLAIKFNRTDVYDK
jgi:ASC-1-like (ASCH) protein